MRRLRSHDQGFVASPPDHVYGLLSDPVSYPGWWPGSRWTGDELMLPLGSREGATPERARPGTGLYLVSGDASLEWFLEPFDDGTIVNAFLDLPAARSQRRASRRLLRMRRALHGGLVGLKQRVETTT